MSNLQPVTCPDYERPPVVETVLSVQFKNLDSLRTVHYGALWQKFEGSFPHTEERPPLESEVERFPGTNPQRVKISMEVGERPPLPRLWFVNASGNELIQVQPSRFIKNWQKAEGNEEYPRYERVIKPAFQRDFALFEAFIVDQGFAPLVVNQCEVTYVNHIVCGEGWEAMGDVEKVFKMWRVPPDGQYPGRMEDCAFHARYPITEADGVVVGRLHVDIRPARRLQDNQPMYVMSLTARGLLGSGTEFLDLGHKWIVHSFRTLTTDHMHHIWGEK